MKLPIFGSDGRTIIGHASGIRSATVILRRLVDVPAGFKLLVWQRSNAGGVDMTEILDLPDGFVYSIYR